MRLLQAKPPGNKLRPRDNDIMLVSYPRSGNTWVRFLISNLIHETKTTFTNIESRIPDIYSTNRWRFACMPGPRIIKSHEPYRSDYSRVIYLVRDPRDVAVSYFWYLRKTNQCLAPEWSEFFSSFLSGTLPYGTWGAHVTGWCEQGMNPSDFLLVRYEELLSDTASALSRIANFIRPNYHDNVASAIQRASFQNMQQEESRTGVHSKPSRHAESDIRFIRQGKAGSWREHLTTEESQLITTKWSSQIRRFGFHP